MLRFAGLIALTIALPLGAQPFSDGGSICGTVLDETGKPARDVRLSATAGAAGGIRPSAKTDQSGHYCMSSLNVGTYFVTADDPERGYPDVFTAFYSATSSDQHVTIRRDALQQQLNWQIPYKAGTLHFELRDAVTGQPITGLTFEIKARANPQVRYMRGTAPSDYPLLVPPNEEVVLIVGAPGYRSWPEDGTSGRLLTLQSGETRTLHLSLQRSGS